MEKIIKTDRETPLEKTDFVDWKDIAVVEGVYLGIDKEKEAHSITVKDQKPVFIKLSDSPTINEALEGVKANFESVKIECIGVFGDDAERPGEFMFEISKS